MGELAGGSIVEGQGVARARSDSAWRAQLEQLQEALASCTQEIARQVRIQTSSELAGNLNRSVRRLRSAQASDNWREALLDAVQAFCDRTALFTVNHRALHLESTRSIPNDNSLPDIALSAAPAFSAAVESGDTIVAMRTKGEMSEAIASYFGETQDGRFHLFPISTRGRVAALLYADGEAVQVDCVDLLACIAGAVLETGSSWPSRTGPFVNIVAARKEPDALAWSELSEQDRELHRKAQRFGRVQIASLRLYKSDDVISGRAERTLYKSFKEEIDAARGVFRRDFIAKSATMVDYFHLELVRTLANDDVELLGPDYPGPMV